MQLSFQPHFVNEGFTSLLLISQILYLVYLFQTLPILILLPECFINMLLVCIFRNFISKEKFQLWKKTFWIKSALINEYQHEPIRIKKEPTRFQRKSTQVNTSTARVRHESTRNNMSRRKVNTTQLCCRNLVEITPNLFLFKLVRHS